MVTVARRVSPEVEWRTADASRLPFPDASFDAVVSRRPSCSSPTRWPPCGRWVASSRPRAASRCRCGRASTRSPPTGHSWTWPAATPGPKRSSC
ncbi:MAG: class I SAM-dependent methyltransferase [Actinomycetota bacterium]|nr:class I SAM-dependent methyltransferase [Actinomycetota bacterium]